MEKQTETMTKDQVTTLLNYWERIIQNLSQAVERTIGEVALQKHRADMVTAAAREMMAQLNSKDVGEEKFQEWAKLTGYASPTVADLVNPPEQVIQ